MSNIQLIYTETVNYKLYELAHEPVRELTYRITLSMN